MYFPFKYCPQLFFCMKSVRIWTKRNSIFGHFSLSAILPSPNTEAVARRCCVIKLFLKISYNSHENTCTRVRPATVLKKRRWHRCFPVNFANFLRALILKNIYEWLLLQIKIVALSIYHYHISILHTWDNFYYTFWVEKLCINLVIYETVEPLFTFKLNCHNIINIEYKED